MYIAGQPVVSEQFVAVHLTSEDVLAQRLHIRPLKLYDLYIAGQPVVSEQFVAVHLTSEEVLAPRRNIRPL